MKKAILSIAVLFSLVLCATLYSCTNLGTVSLEKEVDNIVQEAKQNYDDKEKSLSDSLNRTKSATSNICRASDATIAQCCFEAYSKSLYHPYTARLDGHYNVVKDDYGRVACKIRVTAQNKIGNYITEERYVVLQSCSSNGEYTYLPGIYYLDAKYSSDTYLSAFLKTNHFDEAPETNTSLKDKENENDYNTAIYQAENGQYENASRTFQRLGNYKLSKQFASEIQGLLTARNYLDGCTLFSKGEYADAKLKLDTVPSDYLKAARLMELCDEYISNSTVSSSDSKEESVPNESKVPDASSVTSKYEDVSEMASKDESSSSTNESEHSTADSSKDEISHTETSHTPKENSKEPQAHIHTKDCYRYIVDVPYQAAIYENRKVVDVPYSPAEYGDILVEYTDHTIEVYLYPGSLDRLYFASESSYMVWFEEHEGQEDYNQFAGEVYIDGTRYFYKMKYISDYTATRTEYGLVKQEQPEVSHIEKVLVKEEVKEQGHQELICGYK